MLGTGKRNPRHTISLFDFEMLEFEFGHSFSSFLSGV
jgi:hypothetical protein